MKNNESYVRNTGYGYIIIKGLPVSIDYEKDEGSIMISMENAIKLAKRILDKMED